MQRVAARRTGGRPTSDGDPGPGVDGTQLEGYVDLRYRDDDGLVLVDHKTDAAMGADALAAYETSWPSTPAPSPTRPGEPVTRSCCSSCTQTGALEHAITTEK